MTISFKTIAFRALGDSLLFCTDVHDAAKPAIESVKSTCAEARADAAERRIDRRVTRQLEAFGKDAIDAAESYFATDIENLPPEEQKIRRALDRLMGVKA